ncbi:MAG: NAD(P)-dependent oxidoreductase [Actinomycetota bacterium]
MAKNEIAIEPKSFDPYERAVIEAGGKLATMNSAVEAVIWTDYSQPSGLSKLLDENPQVRWVQLPFAGVDAFSEVIKRPIRFTSAKGSYSEPVAEHALALALALGRKLPTRVKAAAWGKREAVSFYDANILIIGGGGIAQELISLFAPFRASITVVRNDPSKSLGNGIRVLGMESLPEEVGKAQLVVIACALTERTRGLFDYSLLSRLNREAFLINVARGPIVVTADLIRALDEKLLAGAALDVTDPEPLPDGHPLFGRDDLIITPHTADTKEIVTRLFALRIGENVRAYLGSGNWVGEVDPGLGY